MKARAYCPQQAKVWAKRFRRNVRRLGCVCLLLSFIPSTAHGKARQADSQLDDQVSELVELTAKIPSGEKLDIQRRQDLEEILSTLKEKPSRPNVYFYEVHSSTRTTMAVASSVWVVAVVRSERGVYKMYSFDHFAGTDASLQEFNRFVSGLALSISEGNVLGLAKLFLGSYVEGDAKEMVLSDATELQLAVQDYYFERYRPVWSALDEDSRWWRAFRPNTLGVAPTIRKAGNGRYRLSLEKLLTSAGEHPRVQKWQLEVQHDGTIRVLSVRLVFPRNPSRLFYGDPSLLQNTPFGTSPF